MISLVLCHLDDTTSLIWNGMKDGGFWVSSSSYIYYAPSSYIVLLIITHISHFLIEEINLSNNNFTGPFPLFLGELRYLGKLLSFGIHAIIKSLFILFRDFFSFHIRPQHTAYGFHTSVIL